MQQRLFSSPPTTYISSCQSFGLIFAGTEANRESKALQGGSGYGTGTGSGSGSGYSGSGDQYTGTGSGGQGYSTQGAGKTICITAPAACLHLLLLYTVLLLAVAPLFVLCPVSCITPAEVLSEQELCLPLHAV